MNTTAGGGCGKHWLFLPHISEGAGFERRHNFSEASGNFTTHNQDLLWLEDKWF
jgi:hypothetical protein